MVQHHRTGSSGVVIFEFEPTQENDRGADIDSVHVELNQARFWVGKSNSMEIFVGCIDKSLYSG